MQLQPWHARVQLLYERCLLARVDKGTHLRSRNHSTRNAALLYWMFVYHQGVPDAHECNARWTRPCEDVPGRQAGGVALRLSTAGMIRACVRARGKQRGSTPRQSFLSQIHN